MVKEALRAIQVKIITIERHRHTFTIFLHHHPRGGHVLACVEAAVISTRVAAHMNCKHEHSHRQARRLDREEMGSCYACFYSGLWPNKS
jgi:hypothetical protein